MAQLWTNDVFALSHEGPTDLQNIENNFLALKSLFSGATFGLTPEAGHPYFDTSSTVLGQGLLKIRNRTNSGWMGVLALQQESTTGLVWFHGNDMANQEGWRIDTSITQDRVMALKNHGSGTYTTGRQAGGQWDISDLTINDHPHTHSLSNHTHMLIGTSGIGPGYTRSWSTGGPTPDLTGSTNLVHGFNFAGTWRIRAQVGIVIYPDI